MSRWMARVVGPVLLLLGLIVVLYSVLRGSASVSLLLIVPVVSGTSALFLVGVVLLFFGILLLPFAFAAGWEIERRPYAAPGRHQGPAPADEITGGGGGLVLLGPVPVFFGSWRNPSRAAYWAAALVGVVVLAIVLLVLFAPP